MIAWGMVGFALFLGLAIGFVVGTAYGVHEERASEAERAYYRNLRNVRSDPGFVPGKWRREGGRGR